MKQAIAGVSPPGLGEVTVMTIWPSIAASGPGRWIGQMCSIRWPHPIFSIGKVFALALAPAAAALILVRFAIPLLTLGVVNSTCKRYRLTNRRVIIEQGLLPHEEASVGLDAFDTIEVQVLPGQKWYPAGELIFRHGNIETFRLAGVLRPETFRRVCLKSHVSYVAVAQFVG